METRSSHARKGRAALAALAALVALAVLGGRTPAAGGEGEEKGDDVAARVDRSVEAWRPTPAERRIDRISWVADIRAALRIGKELRRPIFLFTHDGRMGSGRQ